MPRRPHPRLYCPACGQSWALAAQACACRNPRSRCCDAPLALEYTRSPAPSPALIQTALGATAFVGLYAITWAAVQLSPWLTHWH